MGRRKPLKDPLNKLWWWMAGKPYDCPECKRRVYENFVYCPSCGSVIEW